MTILIRAFRAFRALIGCCFCLIMPLSAWSQMPPVVPFPNDQISSDAAIAASAAESRPRIASVSITGQKTVTEEKIRRHIKVRNGQIYDATLVRGDVRRLYSTRWFHNVRSSVKETAGGVHLTYQVFERPTIEAIRFIGNRRFLDKKLLKETGLKPADALNSFALREATRKIESLYKQAGLPETSVEVVEGTRPQDRNVVFSISEGEPQRIYSVEFEGNDPSVATDARLRTQIDSKPGVFKYLVWGKFDREQLDGDVEKLIAYYRNLGFFRARVSRELDWGASQQWVTIRFVIDEGPRYQIRSVSVAGNEQFASEDLVQQLQLQQGDYFQMTKLRRDERMLRDLYGAQGFIFVDVEANPRFAEQPGVLDLVYKVNEGEQFRVGKINVHIGGELSRTKLSVVLNRLSLRPGDIIDIREVRASERRLKAANVFETNPGKGPPPRIEIRPLEIESVATEGTKPTFRGQSPDRHRVRKAEIDLYLPPLKQQKSKRP